MANGPRDFVDADADIGDDPCQPCINVESVDKALSVLCFPLATPTCNRSAGRFGYPTRSGGAGKLPV